LIVWYGGVYENDLLSHGLFCDNFCLGLSMLIGLRVVILQHFLGK
jgi:hypothetical protein